MTTVLLVGDSLAVGLTYPMRKLAEARGLSFVADATTGTTARQWASSGRLAADVAANRPDVVLVSLGTNDAHGDDSSFADDVATLIASTGGASVRWIVPPPMPFDMTNVRAVLAASGVPVFPSDKAYPRAADGIHMPPSGYAAWAQDIADAGYLDLSSPSGTKKWIVAGGAVLLLAYAMGWFN